MKKHTILTLFAVLALLVGTAVTSSAYDSSALTQHEARTLSYLALEKRQAAESILQAADARIVPLREKLLAKRLELNALSRNPGVTPQAISALAAEVSSMDTQLRKELTDRAQKLTDATGFVWGQGRGMGSGYGRGHRYGMGQGYGSGAGTGLGRGYGMNDCIYR